MGLWLGLEVGGTTCSALSPPIHAHARHHNFDLPSCNTYYQQRWHQNMGDWWMPLPNPALIAHTSGWDKANQMARAVGGLGQ